MHNKFSANVWSYLPFAIWIVFFGLLGAAIYIGNLQLLYTAFFGALTAFFSYLALSFTREKFRLDLLERRWVIYENVLNFCSIASRNNTLSFSNKNIAEIKEAHDAAEQSFRGIGYHKNRSLFGEDMIPLFNEVDDYYIWLHGIYNQDTTEDRKKWSSDLLQKLKRNSEIINSLPDIFKPYIYFGDYKRTYPFLLTGL